MRFIAFIALLAGAVPACGEWRTTVANAATPYAGIDTFRIAPGSLIRVSYTSELADEPLWIDPASARVTIRLAGSEPVSAVILRAEGPIAVLARVPAELPVGSAEITLDSIAPAKGQIVWHDFRIFTIGDGSGPARADNGLAHPARPGQIVTLWGTGLNGGAVTGALGGQPLEVLYAGPAPGMPGVDQLNLRLPGVVPEGCYTEVNVSVNGEAANVVTLTTGTAPCRHPLRLTPEQLARIDAGGRVAMATIEVNSLIGPPPADQAQWTAISRMEHAGARIMGLAATLAWLFYQPPLINPGACMLNKSALVSGLFFVDAGPVGEDGKPLNFGPNIRLRGPDKSLTLLPHDPVFPSGYDLNLPTPEPVASIDRIPPTVWTPGKWTIEADGNGNLAPFAFNVDLHPPLEITNSSELRTIDRTRDVTVRWNADALSSTEIVSLSVMGNRSSIGCAASANAGAIVIPRNLLAGLEPLPPDSRYPATLSMSVNRPADQPLLVPLSESMPAVFSQSSAILLPVTIR